MSNEEIIEYWKQGYTVEQIVNKSEIVKRCKDENVTLMIRKRVEKVILEYQS